ncbi:hypothetical protein BCR33DRAFT_712687 [Rhizoclosmatium globosum]|uniref:Uncharacterized protein n=1 Tax=Rhizoclosmatium globosum TaxID=329046 RepID=A0A1Y2CXB6_9FUNG|nr:hypothetical protein BCR33DRAFT_712687 [Rhizoclosmatium globosum]|eukprot:ORY51678.1 hypothetical protein BCR33DRAFT_712687 [Rhizoclosmatium globosum]
MPSIVSNVPWTLAPGQRTTVRPIRTSFWGQSQQQGQQQQQQSPIPVGSPPSSLSGSAGFPPVTVSSL